MVHVSPFGLGVEIPFLGEVTVEGMINDPAWL